jgi:hypothetical protein
MARHGIASRRLVAVLKGKQQYERPLRITHLTLIRGDWFQNRREFTGDERFALNNRQGPIRLM